VKLLSIYLALVSFCCGGCVSYERMRVRDYAPVGIAPVSVSNATPQMVAVAVPVHTDDSVRLSFGFSAIIDQTVSPVWYQSPGYYQPVAYPNYGYHTPPAYYGGHGYNYRDGRRYHR